MIIVARFSLMLLALELVKLTVSIRERIQPTCVVSFAKFGQAHVKEELVERAATLYIQVGVLRGGILSVDAKAKVNESLIQPEGFFGVAVALQEAAIGVDQIEIVGEKE